MHIGLTSIILFLKKMYIVFLTDLRCFKLTYSMLQLFKKNKYMISFSLLQDMFVLLKMETAEETHNYSLSIQTVLSMYVCISLMW